MWRQKSRESWLSESYRNTHFFHTSTLVKRRRNHVGGVQDDGGNWLESRREVGKHFSTKFSEIFSTSASEMVEEFGELFEERVSEKTTSS